MKNRTLFPLKNTSSKCKYNVHKYSNLAAYRKKNKIPRGAVYLRLCNLELNSIYTDCCKLIEKYGK